MQLPLFASLTPPSAESRVPTGGLFLADVGAAGATDATEFHAVFLAPAGARRTTAPSTGAAASMPLEVATGPEGVFRFGMSEFAGQTGTDPEAPPAESDSRLEGHGIGDELEAAVEVEQTDSPVADGSALLPLGGLVPLSFMRQAEEPPATAGSTSGPRPEPGLTPGSKISDPLLAAETLAPVGAQIEPADHVPSPSQTSGLRETASVEEAGTRAGPIVFANENMLAPGQEMRPIIERPPVFAAAVAPVQTPVQTNENGAVPAIEQAANEAGTREVQTPVPRPSAIAAGQVPSDSDIDRKVPSASTTPAPAEVPPGAAAEGKAGGHAARRVDGMAELAGAMAKPTADHTASQAGPGALDEPAVEVTQAEAPNPMQPRADRAGASIGAASAAASNASELTEAVEPVGQTLAPTPNRGFAQVAEPDRAETGSPAEAVPAAQSGNVARPDIEKAEIATIGREPDIGEVGLGEPRGPERAGATLGNPAVSRPDTPRHVAVQIAEVISRSGERVVELTLRPEELGRVNLKLHGDPGHMSVALTVERPETMDLIRRHIDLLGNELRRLGYGAVEFSFQGGGQEGPGQQAAQSRAAGFAARGDGAARLTPETDADPPRARGARSGVTGDGIDIRL